MEALNQVLNTQMATQQTQPTRQMEAQIRQMAVVLESSNGGGFGAIGDRRSDNPVNSRDSSGGGFGSGLVRSARLDDDTAPRALSLIDLCRATGTRVSLP